MWPSRNERSVVFRPEGVYEYVERKETAVEKDHKNEEIRRISTYYCLIYKFFACFEAFLFIFRSFSVLPNVTAPFIYKTKKYRALFLQKSPVNLIFSERGDFVGD